MYYIVKVYFLLSYYSLSLMAGTQDWVKGVYGVLVGIIRGEFSEINYNMMIFNKFKSANGKYGLFLKIIKRDLYILNSNSGKDVKFFLKKSLIKNAEALTTHPLVAGETKEGDMLLTNLTSSSIVKGMETMPVGINPKTGGDSYLVPVVQTISNKHDVKNFKILIKYKGKDKYIVKDEVTNKIANKIGNVMESITGKELKNKNLESVKDIKVPMDKN